MTTIRPPLLLQRVDEMERCLQEQHQTGDEEQL
jgi:hypothetical protein